MMTPDPEVARRYVVHEHTCGTHVVSDLPTGPNTQLQQLPVVQVWTRGR